MSTIQINPTNSIDTVTLSGGGEAPVPISELADVTAQISPEQEENPILLLQSMTASSCSASVSSKHSKMSTSAMSVIAATLTSHAEVRNVIVVIYDEHGNDSLHNYL